MDNRIRIGVIGTGHWGRNLARNLYNLGCLTAICDSREITRVELAERYNSLAIYERAEDLLTAEDLDGVVIATPPSTHGSLARLALEAGKHVFVEKPLCLSIEEARELRDLAPTHSRVLMVGHLLLYHPAFRSVRKLVSSGELGQLRYIYSHRLSLGQIRREENALWSFAPHDISMILALTGKMPIRVIATGGHYLSSAKADTTLSHLTFANNIQAHIFVSWLHPYKDHRLIVVGSEGMVAFNDVVDGPEKVLLYRHIARWNGEVPLVDRADAEPVPYDADEPLRLECEAFIDAIQRGSSPPSDADEGIRVLTVLTACQDSLTSGNSIHLDT